MKTLLVLLLLFELKHFFCDYILQFSWMSNGKAKLKGWILPLLTHSLVHALGTFSIIAWFNIFHKVPLKVFILLSILDLVTHFTIDRIKASPKLLGIWKPDQIAFWWTYGGDQLAHHIVNYAIIALLIIGVR